MRAAVPAADRRGAVTLEEVPVPTLEPAEVLIQVRAAGMNRADLLHASGRYGRRAFAAAHRPDVGGMEAAGIVVDVGVDVGDRAEIGAPVMAMCSGAYAEYVAVDASLLLPAPESLSWAERASLPMGLHTEYEALVRLAEIRPGEHVLITGATSGVGLLGVQVARQLRPGRLVATTRSAANADLLSGLGADVVVSSATELEAVVADGERLDVVVDHVGGDLAVTALGLLATGGRLVSVGRMADRSIQLDLTALASRRARVIGTTWKTQGLAEIAATTRGVERDLLPDVAAGRIRPAVAETIRLTEIATGYQLLAAERRPGKVVVTVDQQ